MSKMEYGRIELGNRVYIKYDHPYYVLVNPGTASNIYLDPDMCEQLLEAKDEIDDMRKKQILESGEG